MSDMFQMLAMMAAPAMFLLVCRHLNRRADRVAVIADRGVTTADDRGAG